MGFAPEAGHGGGFDLGGERAWGSGGVVERVDLGGDGFVFVGDDSIRDAGVGEGHLHRAVSEQRGDRFEAHPTVDGLGGEGVAQLVGMGVTDPGLLRDGGDDAMHGAPVDGHVVDRR